MATAKKQPKPTAGKSLATWDEELARHAQEIADNETTSGTGLKTFSTKSGVLSLDEAPMPGNQMAVIILASAYENVYYEGDYDANNPQPPVCFAQALKEVELAPHETVVERGQAQSDACEGCPMNEWGTAERGRGKACKNSRRLVVIPAGSYDRRGELTLIEDPDHYAGVEAAFLKVPVTSVRGYAAFVKQIAIGLRKPPFAVVTRVALVPDPKNQFAMTFEAVQPITDAALFETLLARHEEAQQTVLAAPYSLDVREAPEPRGKPARGKPVAVKGKGAPAAAPAKKTTAARGRKY